MLTFFSMVDRRKKLHRELMGSLPDVMPGVTDVVIPAATAVELMGLTRSPVVVTAPRSPGAKGYVDLWARVRAAVG